MDPVEVALRAHYEDYPYPPRNPRDERSRLLTTFVDHLDLINFYAFGGKQLFTPPFRALVAGGGTGDATLFLAEQLRPLDGVVVHLDVSRASLQVVKARARQRGLDNIEYVEGSLLDLPELSLGFFDYINCCGVLHHLAQPAAGLLALKSALGSGGAMGLMLYGRYGRAPIHHFCDALEFITGPLERTEARVDCCRALLGSLPPTNSLAGKFYGIDPETTSNAELADLFLNPRDVAFSVKEIYEFVENAGLELISFVCDGGVASSLYDPATYVTAPATLDRIQQLERRDREALAEILLGVMVKHAFYVSASPVPISDPRSPEMVPFLSMQFGAGLDGYERIVRTVRESPKQCVPITGGLRTATTMIEKGALTCAVLGAIDGVRAVGEIVEVVRVEAGSCLAEKNLSGASARSAILDELEQVFLSLNRFDWMLLRHTQSPRVLLPGSVRAR